MLAHVFIKYKSGNIPHWHDYCRRREILYIFPILNTLPVNQQSGVQVKIYGGKGGKVM
jgi:hypothetical protein